MKLIRLFSAADTALGETKTPVVFYLKGAPKPMFAPKEKWGETCTIVIDDTEGSAGIKPLEILEESPKFDLRIKFSASLGSRQVILDKSVCSDIIVNGVSIYDDIDSDGYYNSEDELDVYYKFAGDTQGKIPAGLCKLGDTEGGIWLADPHALEVELGETVTDLSSYYHHDHEHKWANEYGPMPGIVSPKIIFSHKIAVSYDVYFTVFFPAINTIIYNGITYDMPRTEYGVDYDEYNKLIDSLGLERK